MNIFFLSTSPQGAARALCNKHIVKMIIEAVQMLWTALHCRGHLNWEIAVPNHLKIYRKTHAGHPTAVWTRLTRENFQWAAQHAAAIGCEYTKRYTRRHACQDAAEWFLTAADLMDWNTPAPAYSISARFPIFDIPVGCTPPPLAITNREYHAASLLLSYRRYYKEEKAAFAKWTVTPEPRWWRDFGNLELIRARK